MSEELMPMSDDEITLRELLAYAYAGASLYADDGELQDSRRAPFIDFLRDSPDDIAAKMRQRGKAALDAAGGERKILSDSARRAEIGRIVEAIVGNENMLDVYRATLGGPPLFTVRGFGGTSANGPTLLDALRALEAEVGGRDEPEGGPAL